MSREGHPGRTVRVLCRSCGYEHMMLNPDWIRRVRGNRGWSLKELARRIGKSPQYLCDIEGGNRRTSRALGTTIYRVLMGRDSRGTA
jgi:ribosome-binding protein aMBF1 (putative translation factor)